MSSNNTWLLRDGLQLRGGTVKALKSKNPLPKARELMLEMDTGKMKMGNGVDNWNDLAYIGGLTEEEWTVVLDDGNDTEITKRVAVWS